MRLRSVELELPGPADAAAFLTGPWGAIAAEPVGGTHYVRGTAAIPYLVGFAPAEVPGLLSVTFEADAGRIAEIAVRGRAEGLAVSETVSSDPGGGTGIVVCLPDGERFRFLSGCGPVEPATGDDAPVKLTHVVFNAVDAERTAALTERVFGFRVSDRTVGMVFVRCNSSHHSVAFARAGYTSLNHIAFEMADLEAVMRGIGRMRDIGFEPAWGPGRHGPGDNVFGYFIAPFGAVVEFSTAVEEVGDDYHTGAPEDWTWPPGRIDRWGISGKDIAALGVAERRFRFPPVTMSAAGAAA